MDRRFVERILALGQRYREEMLLRYYSCETLLSDWWQALRFFFGRAFYQGRRNEVSEKVFGAAMEVLDPICSARDGVQRRAEHEENGWRSVREQLGERIGKGKVGKARDIEMAISALEHVGRLPKCNIVASSVARIRASEIERDYKELQRRHSKTGIVQVGPKVAALYLRDVVSLYELEALVPEEFQFCLQPVDVWVRRLAKKTGLVAEAASDAAIRDAIVSMCRSLGCSPVQFNQGAWYAGSFAFELLLEQLSRP